MIRTRLLIIMLLLLAASSQARLGESLGRCNRRYGEPVREEDTEGGVLRVYQKSSFEVTVEFEKRKALFRRSLVAVKVTFRKPATGDGAVPLTEGELKTLLAANASKMKWREMDMHIEAARTSDVEKRVQLLRDSDRYTIWTREDHAQAVHDKQKHTLFIRSQGASGHKTLGTDSDLSGF